MSFNQQGGGLPYSANPLQRFTSLKKARFAAKGGAVVAALYGGWCILSLILILLMRPDLGYAQRLAIIIVLGVFAAVLLLLAWRIWVRPGPVKIGFLVALCALNLLNFSVIGFGLTLALIMFAVVALRGALAMPKFAQVGSLDQFD
jgi:hypothetical protein